MREPSDIAVVPVNQDVAYESSATIYVTRAFVQRFAGRSVCRLRSCPAMRSCELGSVTACPMCERSRPRLAAIAGDGMQILPSSEIRQSAAAAQRGIGVEVVALLIFAAVAAIATILVVTLNVDRLLRGDTPEHARLSVLGMTRRQRFAIAFARPFLIAVAEVPARVIVACGVTVDADRARPPCRARPGLDLNVAILALRASPLWWSCSWCARR